MEMRRELEDYIAYDRCIGGVWCTPTGYEVCMGNPDNPGDWWVEYEGPNGEMEYSR